MYRAEQMNVMQEKSPVSRAGGHRAGNYFQSKGTSGGKKDVVLSHFEFDNCVSFILSSFPRAFQESSPRGFMRRSPLSKALLFTGIIQRTYLEVEFLSFRYTYRVGKGFRILQILWKGVTCACLILARCLTRLSRWPCPPSAGQGRYCDRLLGRRLLDRDNSKIILARAMKKITLDCQESSNQFHCLQRSAFNDTLLGCCI